MRSRLCKIMTVLLILCFTLPVLSFAEKDDGISSPRFINGYIPVNKEVNAAPESAPALLRSGAKREFPEKYRSDEQVWAEGIKVKYQAKTALCWAFSITTAAEYSYAKEVYEQTGKTGVTPELSPAHLGQFFYGRENDPLGNTGGDRNNAPYYHWSLVGGNQIYALQQLATFSGLGAEVNTPFKETNDRIISKNGYYVWNGESEAVYDGSYAYNNALTLEECAMYYNPDADTLKALITDYGAVSTALCFDTDKYMNLSETIPGDASRTYPSGASFYNYTDNSPLDHAVTIIGWDDAYPKERFAHKIKGMSDDEAYALTTPERDGAWVVQNSWGANFHDGGFFYASYGSKDLNMPQSDFYVYNVQPADTYIYNFMYDGSSDCCDTTDNGNDAFRTNGGAGAANIFTNTAGESVSVDAVSYITFSGAAAESRVRIYKGLSDLSDPESGALMCEQTAASTSRGTKTVALDSPVTVEPGETFSVVFDFYNANAFGVEKKRNASFDVETAPGQSFFRASGDGNWTDMNDYGACFRIKALANPVNCGVYGNRNADGTASVTVKNAPESALLLAARKQDGKITGVRVLPVSEAFSSDVFIPGDGKEITLALLDGDSLAPVCEAKKLASQ